MKKILVIEDNLQIRENICEILELADYKVFNCENGYAGVEMAGKELPDIIVCDIMMPGFNGYEVLARLKENSLTHNIPFVFLTAKAEINDKQLARNMGAVDYISKPFDSDDLVSIIQCRIVENEARKKQFNIELSEYITVLEQMLHMTSHRVRKPVCNSLGLVQLLEVKGLETINQEELKKIIDYIKANCLDLDFFTKELTEFLHDIKLKFKSKIL